MTQRQRLEEYLKALPAIADLEAINERVYEVLGEAQNGPPEGGADGTIPEHVWYAANSTQRSLQELVHYLRAVREVMF